MDLTSWGSYHDTGAVDVDVQDWSFLEDPYARVLESGLESLRTGVEMSTGPFKDAVQEAFRQPPFTRLHEVDVTSGLAQEPRNPPSSAQLP